MNLLSCLTVSLPLTTEFIVTTTAFSTLPLAPAMLENLASLGYHTMTPIQAQSLPVILAGRDIIAKAKTGSGKTAAFAIGLLNKLDVKQFATQALVLCPTRELADQVAKEIRRLARFTHNVKVLTLCGGVSIGPQLGSLERGAHIVVGTPGRIVDHLGKGSLSLQHLQQLVLDEADRMLEMGFADALETVLQACPPQRQTLLFSATYPEAIQKISAHCQHDPLSVTVDASHSEQQIEQHFYELQDGQHKHAAIKTLLAYFQPQASLIFCNTKQQCDEVCTDLRAAGISALALHGDLEQRDRDQTLVRFANKSCSVLVATDVAARGLDIKGLDAVINYDLSRDPEVHVHRIGRTGRAGATGLALSLIAPNEVPRLNRVEDYVQQTLTLESLPVTSRDPAELQPQMVTLCIDGGRKEKLRPGDILGALIKDAGLSGDTIGKIDIFDFCAYVAVSATVAKKALQHLQQGKLKGRKFKARQVR